MSVSRIVSVVCLVLLMASTQLMPFHLMYASTPPAMPDDIIAFYETHTESSAIVEAVLRNFRVYYATATLFFCARIPKLKLESYAHFYGAKDLCMLDLRTTDFKWILVLRDDIWLYSRVPTGDLEYDINVGCNLNGSVAVNRSCSLAGAIVRSSLLLQVNLTSEMTDQRVIEALMERGGTLGPYTGYSETWWRWGNVILRSPRWPSI
jgi:hypothetical protein